MTEGVDPVLVLRGDIICYFEGYFKADLLIAIYSVVIDLCSVSRGGLYSSLCFIFTGIRG